MDGTFFIITRIFYKGSSETHSVEIKTDRQQAAQRVYNIVAADLADSTITYQFVDVVDCYGSRLYDFPKPIIYDRRPEPVE